jgi:cysteine-rich repeat protein
MTAQGILKNRWCVGLCGAVLVACGGSGGESATDDPADAGSTAEEPTTGGDTGSGEAPTGDDDGTTADSEPPDASTGGSTSEDTIADPGTGDPDSDTTPAAAVCGDGVIQVPEVCDDDNTADGDGCQADCTPTPAVCGDGAVEGGEACDDGNTVDGGADDFCTNTCEKFMPPDCQAPMDYAVCDDALSLTDKTDKTAVHRAIGICDQDAADSVQISDFSFAGPDNASWQIARGFGTYKYDHDNDLSTPKQLLYRPREGGTFLMLSTGRISLPNDVGVVVEPPNSQEVNGANANPDNPKSMPAPLHDAMGSNGGAGGTPFAACDGVNDCSDTLFNQWNQIAFHNPFDKLSFKFVTTVPEGTYGYQFDFVFCSAEYPLYVGQQYNDMFIAWQTDPTPDEAYTGNITFIPDPDDPTKQQPLTITALAPYYSGSGYSDSEPQLDATGFETHGCSDWFTARGAVNPGADVTIGFFLTDMGDDALASVAILDNFRWDCKGCTPTEVQGCGVKPPQ